MTDPTVQFAIIIVAATAGALWGALGVVLAGVAFVVWERVRAW